MSIKCAKKSPRICDDGSIRWYEGDTFVINFALTFKDDADNILPVEASDEISICFNDIRGNVVYEKSVKGTNVLTIEMNEDITKLFTTGSYYYCVKRNADFITTLMKHNMVVVE